MNARQGLSGAIKLAQAAVTPQTAMSEKRLALCLNCNDLDKQTERCKVCTCFVRAKTKLVNEACPIGKW